MLAVSAPCDGDEPSAPVGRSSDEEGAGLGMCLDPDHEGLTCSLFEDIQIEERRFHKFEPWTHMDNDWREFLMRFRQKAFAAGSASSVDRERVRECAEMATQLRVWVEGLAVLYPAYGGTLERAPGVARELESELRRLCDGR